MEQHYPQLPENSEDVLAKLTNSDPEHVEVTVEICKQLFTTGQQRGRDIDQKASILIGTAGVAVAISTAIGAFIVAPAGMLQGWPLVVIFVLFVLLVLSSFISVVLALRVIWVEVESIPGPLTIFEQQSFTSIEFRKAYASDLFTAFVRNIPMNNNRVSKLLLSQIAFTVFVSTLLLTGIFIASVAIFVD